MTATTSPPGHSALRTLTAAGLIATTIGFLGASINSGHSPHTMEGAPTIGPLHLPPLL